MSQSDPHSLKDASIQQKIFQYSFWYRIVPICVFITFPMILISVAGISDIVAYLKGENSELIFENLVRLATSFSEESIGGLMLLSAISAVFMYGGVYFLFAHARIIVDIRGIEAWIYFWRWRYFRWSEVEKIIKEHPMPIGRKSHTTTINVLARGQRVHFENRIQGYDELRDILTRQAITHNIPMIFADFDSEIYTESLKAAESRKERRRIAIDGVRTEITEL